MLFPGRFNVRCGRHGNEACGQIVLASDNMKQLSHFVQLAALLSLFTVDAQSMCAATMSPTISVCQDKACDSAAVEVGDTVTFQVCVQNLSFEIPGSSATTPVSAVLQANTEIEIFLACTTGTCADGMWAGTLRFQSYTPAAVASTSTITIGTTASCTDSNLCGLLALSEQLALPRYDQNSATHVCLGTITTTAVDKPDSDLGLFYQKSDTGPSDLLVTDPTCVGGLTGGGGATSVARF